MRTFDIIALTLLIVGGINWGLVGLFDINLVASLFGPDSVASNVIYALVGVAGIYAIALFKPLLRSPVTHDQPHHEKHASHSVR